MRLISGEARTFVIRFDRDEEVMQGIAGFCAEKDIAAASFQMIGASSSVTLSYWNIEKKEYEEHVIEKDLEVAGIMGNVGLLGGERIVHAHGTLSDRDLTVVGGHVKRLVVSATMEVVLTALPGAITRMPDEATGLNLMS